jgi:hypothetical protein
MTGADPDALDRQAHRLVTAADRLEAIRGEITTVLARTAWEGGDGDDFRHDWETVLSGRLRQAAEWLQQASSVLHGNAEQQRQASSDFGGVGSSALGGVGGGIAWGKDFDHLLKGAEVLVAPMVAVPKLGKAVQKMGLDIAERLAGAKAEPLLTKIGGSEIFKAADEGLAGVGLVYSIGALIQSGAPTTGDGRYETADHEVSAVLDSATLITAAVPGLEEVAPVVAALSGAYALGSLVDPHLGQQIVDVSNGFSHAVGSAEQAGLDIAKIGFDTEVDVAKTEIHAAGAVAGIVGHGVSSALHVLHL